MDMAVRAIHAVLTLYMMVVLLRWLSPSLQVDVYSPKLRWVCHVTDPLLRWLRRILPYMGPMDFAPLVLLLAAWLVRDVSVALLAGVGPGR